MKNDESYQKTAIENTDPLAFSTPVNKLKTSRPLPKFSHFDSEKLFQLKRNRPFNERTLHPKSPVKSAPPVSRVFPYRLWAPEKPHAISFRLNEDQTADSALSSKFYNSDCSELYFEQCFTIEKKLGEGSFGEVMQVKSRDTEQRYAVKRSRDKFKNESDRRRKLDEVKKHEKLPFHPNCVKFIKAWEEKQRLYIQTELCSMSLQGYMEEHHFIPVYYIWKYLIDLLHGLQHIHSHGYIHFDVKPANIFLCADGSCKIGDFGLVVDSSNDDMTNAREGDNKYMASELLHSVFTEKADVFSLGIAILEIACDLDLPSSGVSWQLLRSGYFPKECKMSFSLRTIIQWMMTPDHRTRPTVSEVLNHPHIISYKQRLKPILFLQKYSFKFLCFLSFAMLYFLHKVLWLPLKVIKIPLIKKSALEKITTQSDIQQWKESSSSSSQSPLSCDPIAGFTDSASTDNAHLLITPNLTHQYTPTPRNSSPLAHRTGGMSRHSPDLSPLSHTAGNRSCKKYTLNQSKLSKTVHGFDFFVSDNSDVENSCDEDVKVLSFRPRNFLDMLNDVSDSDHSNCAMNE